MFAKLWHSALMPKDHTCTSRAGSNFNRCFMYLRTIPNLRFTGARWLNAFDDYTATYSNPGLRRVLQFPNPFLSAKGKNQTLETFVGLRLTGSWRHWESQGSAEAIHDVR